MTIEAHKTDSPIILGAVVPKEGDAAVVSPDASQENSEMHVRKTTVDRHPLSKSLTTIIKRTPIPIAGLALGLAALGNLLQPFGEEFHVMLGATSAFLILLLTIKLLMFPKMIREDFGNSVLASVSAAYLMTIMQLSGYVAPMWYEGAFALWGTAIIAHLVLMTWFTYRFLAGGRFKLEHVFPSYFLCFAGNVVASVVSPIFGMQMVGSIILWWGFAAMAILFVIVTYRYAKVRTPEPIKPMFCIYGAPASLLLVAYLSVTADPNMTFVVALAVVAQFLYAVVLVKLPSLLRLKFYPSYAAMTFPFVISATALGKSLAVLGVDVASPLFWLAGAEIVLAIAMVLYVFARYMGWLFGGVVRSAVGNLEGEPAEAE